MQFSIGKYQCEHAVDEIWFETGKARYECELKKDSNVFKAYKTKDIVERHRHRYEFNNKYIADFENAGMIATGINKETNLVEIIEMKNHKWFVGVQFHPEYRSTVINPHPLFVEFVKMANS